MEVRCRCPALPHVTGVRHASHGQAAGRRQGNIKCAARHVAAPSMKNVAGAVRSSIACVKRPTSALEGRPQAVNAIPSGPAMDRQGLRVPIASGWWAVVRVCGCRYIIRPAQTACWYACRVPPSPSRRQTSRCFICAGTLIGLGSGQAGFSARCGRCQLQKDSNSRSACRRWLWFQIKVRSRNSRRHVCIQRSIREFLRGIWMPVVTAFGRRRRTARHRGEAAQCWSPSRWRDL